jgi:hypothetical protein
MREADVPGRSFPVCGSVVFSILLTRFRARTTLQQTRGSGNTADGDQHWSEHHVRQSQFSQSFQTNEDSGELPVRVAFLEHAALVSDRTFRVMAERRSPQERQKGRSDGHNRQTSLFRTPKRSNLDQLKVNWSPVPLYFAAFFPSTPAENASQPSPAQAPAEPLVGSKLKPKTGESKYEASTGSAGP